MVGSHEELYRAMETDRVDLVLNDQRRAFSDRYNNEILAESRMYIEISSRNTLGRLEMIDIAELKNIPCILMTHPDRDICPSMGSAILYGRIPPLTGFLSSETGILSGRHTAPSGERIIPGITLKIFRIC